MPTYKRKTVEVLKLIKDEDHWTQRAAARNKHGQPCYALSKNARSFCILGAAHKLYGDDTAYMAWLKETVKKYTDRLVSEFNDKNKHEDIINLLNAIILVQK